ncbi:MAG: LCP family protein [Actinomycetota bacterium]
MPEVGRHRSAGRRRAAASPQGPRRSAGRGRVQRSAPPTGPRRKALEQKRRQRKQRSLKGTGVLVVLGLIVVGGLAFFGARAITGDGARSETTGGAGSAETLQTLLVIGTQEESGSAASWMNLLAYDSATGEGAAVYLPAHTAVEVPGRGLTGVGEAFDSGNASLLQVSVENLLGISIDHYLELSSGDSQILFNQLGDLEIDIPGEVRIPAGASQARVLFNEGAQIVPPDLLDDFLFTIGLDGDEAELGNRHLAFWDGLFETFAGRDADLASAVEGAGPALTESDLSPAEQSRFLQSLAGLEEVERHLTVLPVQQEIVGDAELYSTDEEEIESFVETVLGEQSGGGDETRVQILNGNGAPGVGQAVADRLVGQGYEVVLSGNANRLDYQDTLIITYDDSEESRAGAEEVKELLKVGEVQVSVQQQGIVDLTIVVGKDFLGTTQQGEKDGD